MFEEIYWRKGAIETKTGEKTLTLRLFEEKYNDILIRIAYEYKNRNMWSIFKRLPYTIQEDQEVVSAMKRFDTLVNVNWPLAHYKYAVRYLFKSSEEVTATGGTNWRKYLPPRFQKRIFFPDIYSLEEVENWGKSWVETQVLSKNPEKAVK